MARAPWAASPILQSVWALCSHPDYVDGCEPCTFRLSALLEYLFNLKRRP